MEENKKKIAIIGFGAATIGMLDLLKDKSDYKVYVFEKNSKDNFSSGLQYDGKIFCSNEMGGNSQEVLNDLELQNYFIYHLVEKFSPTDFEEIEQGISFDINSDWYNKFYSNGFEPVHSNFYHLGTDQLKILLQNVLNYYSNFEHIHFQFNCDVKNITRLESNLYSIDNSNLVFDKIYIAAGRSGFKLVNSIIKQFPELKLKHKSVDIGVRYEIPDNIVSDINKEMYEFKVKYKAKSNYIVRTFCNNPSGEVVMETHNNFNLSNGHSNSLTKTKNTNMALLVTVDLTEPFDDSNQFGEHIAKLSNLVAGKDKILLQTYGKFKECHRTKNFNRLKPTLSEKNYTLGDINLIMPRRICESLIEFIEQMDKVIHGFACNDNLMYFPEIKFYGTRIDNDNKIGIKMVGDCSGWSRSIIHAMCHGYLTLKKDLM